MPGDQPRAGGDAAQEIARIARSLSAHLEWLAASGALGVPAETPGEAVAAAAAEPEAAAGGEGDLGSASEPRAAPGAGGAAVGDVPELAAAGLAAVRAELGECRRCRLAAGRRHLVFGVGNPRARLVFVGEGPGRDEDRLGEPFVGKAGQLLTDIIEKGMRLRRADVYICNVVKCRPPENRDPEPDEIAACRPFLLRQLEVIRPEVVVALGRVAAQALLGNAEPIGRMRGRWREVAGIPVMPTLHPAYLLRNPAEKRLVWEDVKQVMRRLGLGP